VTAGGEGELREGKGGVSGMKTKRNGSFTLIEMLVVIAVIGILSGIVFKLYSMVNRRDDEAKCLKLLECIGNALSEYYVEYGQYPPVSGMTYVCEDVGKQHPNFRDVFLPQNPDWDDNVLFSYAGLVAWLWPRDPPANGAAWPKLPGYKIRHRENVQYVGDTARDQAAKERWARFLEEIDLTTAAPVVSPNWVNDGYDRFNWPYTNMSVTVLDPWGTEVQYQCPPPHLSYKLWSFGPDKTNSTDDIHRDRWDL
jgi:prepilin-type N-terminal cleavage/methylation domain-containing protein